MPTPRGFRSYDVIFYVNDVMYDYASNLNGVANDTGRDSEILSSVFYVMKKKADYLGATELTFNAISTEKDVKVITKLNPEPHKTFVMSQLKKAYQELQAYQPQLVQPSQTKIDLFKKLNRGIPEPELDLVGKEHWLTWIQDLMRDIEKNERIQKYINDLHTAEGTGNLIFRFLGHLIGSLQKVSNIIDSNTGGFYRGKNRRAEIYKRIVNKNFADWKIEINGTYFRLSRPDKQF